MAKKRRAHKVDREKLGSCKIVKQKKTGCSIKLCYTGKGATGWSFMKGTSSCSSRKHRR